MLASSEKFPEQFLRVQQQFKEWPAFDQLCAIVELTRTFQLSYRHFLGQLFQSQILNENNDMFKHIVDDANAPDIVSCLLSNTLDKILFTLQLYLPSISITTINEKLFDAYRDVLIALDSNLINPTKFSYPEQKIILFCQRILFFIQTNPILTRLTVHIPRLTQLVQTKQFPINNEQSFQPLLQRYSSVRQQTQLSKTNIPEEVHANLSQQLTRLEINDSGLDLSEPSLPQPLHNFLSSRSILDRTNNKHTFVGKTASSPIPEHGTLNIPVRTPLKGVLSAPSTTLYSDARQKNTNYQQLKHRSTLAKSDEDEQESQQQQQQFDELTNEMNMNSLDNSRPLGQFYSFRYRNGKNNSSNKDVSQYLDVDALGTPARNTFLQPNTGMKDVPKWLKTLRLHKYDVFFSQMTYDQMMNLTIEELKQLGITDGACTKILIHIKKLKERSILLQQCLVDINDGLIDLPNVIVQLSEILSTPVRSRQLEIESNSDEDLPQLIIKILERVNQQITPTTSSDISNSFLGLFDRFYRHEAFTDNQRYALLQWRGRLSSMLQSTGKIEFKKIQSVHSYTQQRRDGKPPVRSMKSTSGIYHQNYSSTSVPLTKFNSEPQNNNLMDLNFSRRPNKSPTYMHPTPTEEESNEMTNFQTSFTCLTSTPQRNNGAYLANNQHQTLTRKASIDPHGETNTHNRTKLCKTSSDPNRMRFYNSSQLSNMQSSPRSQQTPPTSLFQMISTPYSQQQQQRQFVARSPPSSTTDTSTSPIKECYPDDEQSDYYGNPNSTTSISNSNELETSDEQRQKNTEMESFCRQVTDSAINDDVHESSIDHQENVLNVQQSSNDLIDAEQ